MKSELSKLEKSATQALQSAGDLEELNKIKVAYLGKQGSVTSLLKSVGKLPKEERPNAGKEVNVLRGKLEALFQEHASKMEELELEKQLENEIIDTSLPGKAQKLGQIHPLSLVEQKIINIFQSLGFSVAEGPEIEDDYYNFEALNFPKDHPARDMQDTLFLEGDKLLRTHTSPTQIRYMEQRKAPVRIVSPGRVYRHDFDATHSPVFHQVEGLCVGKDITFEHLKGTLEAFIHMIFW